VSVWWHGLILDPLNLVQKMTIASTRNMVIKYYQMQGLQKSGGSVDPPLFRVCGPHVAFDPTFLSAVSTLTPIFCYPPRPLTK